MGKLIDADILITKLKTLEEYEVAMGGRRFGVTEAKYLVENTPTVESYTREEVLWLMQNEYRRGWHHALNKALNESYSIHCEEGTFDVVQNKTLMALGMYMDSALGESCDSILQKVKAYGVTKCGEKHDSN